VEGFFVSNSSEGHSLWQILEKVMEQTWYVAMIWIGLALLASVISMRTAISVALVEICVGVLGGNFLGLDPKAEWISFLAGSAIQPFCRAEIERKSFANMAGESQHRVPKFFVTISGGHVLCVLRS
jgi:hypothetical protein